MNRLRRPATATLTPLHRPIDIAPLASAAAAVADVLLSIVAEKTGYPPEMLELDMQLDADLGIDSIKRVEILSAVQDRIPEAPVVGPEQIGTLRHPPPDRRVPPGPSQARSSRPGEPAAPARNGDAHSRCTGRSTRAACLRRDGGCGRASEHRRREDRLSAGDARAGHAARRRLGHRLDQAGGDSLGGAGPASRGARGRSRADRDPADPPPDRRVPRPEAAAGCS